MQKAKYHSARVALRYQGVSQGQTVDKPKKKGKTKKTKGENMKITYTPDQINDLICELKITKTEFCRKVGLNRGTFSRFMRGKRYLSERVSNNIYAIEQYYKRPKAKKQEKLTVWQKIKKMLGV